MTTCREIEPVLSDLSDGSLTPEARVLAESHLDSCPACRGVLRDLERIRRAAGSLGPMPPPDHIWLEVAGQVRSPARGARTLVSAGDGRVALRQWIGLAAMLALVTLGAYFVMRTPPPPAGNAGTAASVQAFTEELTKAMQHYDNAIGQLEKLTKERGGSIDPAIAATLQRNILTIDGAIAESRDALGQDPQSQPARESLFEALKSKVGVLQATLNLMNEMRKGDQAAAAEAAAVFGKKS